MNRRQERGYLHGILPMLKFVLQIYPFRRVLILCQIFNASHMAPYDVPLVTHDMILRFVDMNFSAIVGGSARIPSSIGDESKPIFHESPAASQTPGKTPDEIKAQWEGEKVLIQEQWILTWSSLLQCWFSCPGTASHCHCHWTMCMVSPSETSYSAFAGFSE